MTITGSPVLEGDLAHWKYALSGILYFSYQTLDGSDGKQARRTSSGSALGELMDHGIDAVSTTFLVLITTDIFGFGIRSVYPWAFVLIANLSFFLSNMTLVHSGRQKFFDVDVMEIQTTMILALLFAGFFGTGFFENTTVPLPQFVHHFKTDILGILKPEEPIDFTSGSISMKMIIVIGGVGGCLVNYPQYMFAAIRPYLLKHEDQPIHVKAGVTGTGFGNLVCHLVLVHCYIAICICAVALSKGLVGGERVDSIMRSLPFVLAFSFGDLMNRVLMRVSHEPLPLMPSALWPLIGFVLACYNDDHIRDLELAFGAPGGVVYWILAVITVCVHLSYFYTAVVDLAQVLGIHPFKIKPKHA